MSDNGENQVIDLAERRAQKREHFTDLGNAHRLIRCHGDDLRFVHEWGRWLCWDGRRWATDSTDEIMRRAAAAVATIYQEASELPEGEQRKKVASFASRSESERGLRAMVALAKTIEGVSVGMDELDQDPTLLNCENGTINLETGKLYPHNRDDLITKMVPVEYRPDLRPKVFTAFLERIVPDPELRAFVQRAVGYSLTGLTTEQVLFVIFGNGANGKSTLVELLHALLGDYFTKASPELLLAKKDSGIPSDVAALRGARLVAVTETEEGRRFAEVRVKELVGGDHVSARHLYGEWFSFRPQAKFWIATNHKPRVRGTDDAIWRRLRLIPFEEKIDAAQRDLNMLEKLIAELPAVLAWAVEGCLKWRRSGLNAPKAVTETTKEYRQGEDLIAGFLAECCAEGDDLWATSSDLFDAFRAWSGDRSTNRRVFSNRLQERGFKTIRVGHSRTRAWKGIGLLAEAGADQ